MMAARPRPGGQGGGQLRRNALGIGSFVLGLFLLLLLVETLWYPYLPYFPWPKDVTAGSILLWMCVLGVLSLGMGVAGLKVAGANKIYPALGILLSISPFVLYILIVMAATAGG
jgi:hypothetical protein